MNSRGVWWRVRSSGLAAVASVALLLSGCQGGQPAAPTPVAPVKVATQTPAVQDDWAQVKASGKILVGTSADYAPFAYHDPNFKIDGFDVALAQQLGQRLGLQVELQDFAFDGLLGAVQLHQVDAAIGAISVTDERARQVAFSRVYFAGEDAVLSRASDKQVTINQPQDMAQRLVGVQHGSVYESWLQNTLVTPGLMRRDHLLPYTNIGQAMTDLADKRLDLVMMDYLPAQTYVNGGSARLAGRDLNKQNFAIAVRKGSTLQAQVDKALGQLQLDGVVGQLSEKYLGIKAKDLPTPAPAPLTPVPAPATAVPSGPTPPPPTCITGMAWVQDLTLDDHGMKTPPVVTAGQSLSKGWRVRNSGSCPWKPGFALTFVTGNVPAALMNGQPVRIAQDVPVNGVVDLQAKLVAPQEPGVYQGIWQMVDDKGIPFGQRIWVGVQVPVPPTPTVAPTQTSAPGITFTADRSNVRQGEKVVITWTTQGMKAVYLSQQGQTWRQYGVAGTGTRDVYPQQTTIYELHVVRADNSVSVRQIRIDVTAQPGAPYIAVFSVQPGTIQVDQCVGVDWDVQGAVSNVRILVSGQVQRDGAPTRGHFDDCPARAGGVMDVQYLVEASGSGGVSRQERWVHISSGPEPTSVPPTAEPLPTFVPAPTEEPAPTMAPAPTEEPAPTMAPAPTEEPAPTMAPAPTEEPAPTMAPAPTEAPVPTETPEEPVLGG